MLLNELTVQVRDVNLNLVGQVPPEYLVDAVLIRRYKNPGSWSLKIPADEPIAEALRTPGSGIQVIGPGDITVLSGPTLSAKLTQSPEDVSGVWEITGTTDEVILAQRLAYPEPTNDNVQTQAFSHDRRSGKAETVIKEYVDANLGSSAPNSRKVDSLVIETDLARGKDVAIAARFNNVQELIYGISESSGLGYKIDQVDDELVFDVYEPVDRSDFIRMDVENDLLTSAEYEYASPSATRVIVAGQGEAIERLFVETSTTNSLDAENLWARRIEVFRDARQTEFEDELIEAGEEQLAETGKTQVAISVTPSNDIEMRYLYDWFLGDRVSITSGPIETTAIVTEVGLSIQADGIRVGVTVGEPAPMGFEAKLIARSNDQEKRISQIERNENFGASGQIGRVTSDDVTITTAGVYEHLPFGGTFDTATAQGFVASTTNPFGVKNNTDVTRIMRIYGSADARGGNNQTHGIKLAKNGTAIDLTECRAFTGSANQEAKLVTSWIIRMEPGDEVTLMIANISNTDNITVFRGRIVATAV
jgi:hypothetical protein